MLSKTEQVVTVLKQLCWICIADMAVARVNYITVANFPGYPYG